MNSKLLTLFAIMLLAMPLTLACHETSCDNFDITIPSFGEPVIVEDTMCACPFTSSDDFIVIDLGDLRLRSDQTVAKSMTPFISAVIPEGYYDITLVSYDGYSSRKNVVQPHEQWHLALGNLVSGTIMDLPDKVRMVTVVEKVNENFYMDGDLTQLKAVHSFYPNSNPNSVVPVCAVFEKIPENEAPEFGVIGGLTALALAGLFIYSKRGNKK